MTDTGASERLLREFQTIQRQIDALPPAPVRLYATHAVPYGRVFRMWNTRGQMIAYVNRGEIADMKRVKPSATASPFGIPVVVL